MLSLWRWTFARIYVRVSRKWGASENPPWAAAFAVSYLILSNFLSLFLILAWVFEFKPFGAPQRYLLVVVFLTLPFLLHHRYVVKGSVRKLIREIERESPAKTRREERKRWAYVVGSLATPLVIVAIRSYLDGK